jgi:hypothetical protein
VSQGEPHPWLTRAHAAQGGITLGPEQGELEANFCHLGRSRKSAGSSACLLRSSTDYGIVTKNVAGMGGYGRAVQEMDKNALFSEGRILSCSDTPLTEKQR